MSLVCVYITAGVNVCVYIIAGVNVCVRANVEKQTSFSVININ